MKNNTYVAIMAGGVGSRFWPASREARPKQFLDILGVGKSLLRLTFERFLHLCPAEHIYIVTNGMYRDLVLEQLPEIDAHQVLCEPSRNNTAPCIAYTAFKLQALNPDANLVVAPSDHVILQEANFVEVLKRGLAFTAAQDALLTLGIQPTRPDTGYGYIHYERAGEDGLHPVRKFTEKPSLDKALEMLATGEYLWNAGIFVWRTAVLLEAFARHAPEIHRILGAGGACYNTAEEQSFIDEAYPTTPNISVDFAIMEQADNVFTIPSAFGWSDLGTWASLHAETEKDADGNLVNGEQVLLQEVHDSLIRVPKGKLAVVRGLTNFIVVDEGDVLLIYPKDREQDIKALRTQVGEQFGDALI